MRTSRARLNEAYNGFNALALMHYLERKLLLQPCLLSNCKSFRINKAILHHRCWWKEQNFTTNLIPQILAITDLEYYFRILKKKKNRLLMMMFGAIKQEERVKFDILAQLFSAKSQTPCQNETSGWWILGTEEQRLLYEQRAALLWQAVFQHRCLSPSGGFTACALWCGGYKWNICNLLLQ